MSSDVAVICETGKACTSATVKDKASGTDGTVFGRGIGLTFTCS